MDEQTKITPASPYQRIVGQTGLDRVLDDYYRQLKSDPLFRTLYIKLRQMRPQQTLFLMQITGGPIREADRLIEWAHAGLRVEPSHFDAMMKYLTAALRANGLAEDEITEVVGRAESMRSRIVC